MLKEASKTVFAPYKTNEVFQAGWVKTQNLLLQGATTHILNLK